MRSWGPSSDYYAITLTASIRRQPEWSMYSHFVGPSARQRGWEKRKASIVDPARMVALWEGLGQSWLVVDDLPALGLWARLGGNALVEAALADEHLPRVVATREVAPNGTTGFLNADSLTKGQLARRLPRAARDQVFERDDHTCRRCGRANSEVRLTRHHVLARTFGGLTQVNNLVTLCDDCHDACHADDAWPPAPDLHGVLLSHALDGLDEDYDAAVARYREVAAALTD
jgi:hypothetical protein